MEELVGFILAGFALAGSPGPANISLAAVGAAYGGRGGLGYLCGIVAGMAGVIAVAASGVTGAVLAVPGLKPVLTAAAALYFLYLAWRIATAPPLDVEAGQGRRPAFAAGLFLSLVNPKAYAAMTALFSGFILTGGQPGFDVAVKIAVLAGIVIAVTTAWLYAGAALTRAFRTPRLNRAINLAFAALLLASLLPVVLA